MKTILACLFILGLLTPASAEPGKSPHADSAVDRSKDTSSERFGEWSIDADSDVVIAHTTNDQGAVFGLLCADDRCNLYLNTMTSCENEHSYEAMLNSVAGLVPIKLKCTVLSEGSGGPRYILVVDGAVTKDVFASGKVSIAMPIAGGEFNVHKFSNDGALDATNRAAALWAARGKPSSPKKKTS